jgi:hypothetical protein
MDQNEKQVHDLYEEAHRIGDKEKAAEFYKRWVLGKPLSLSGKATDHIWCMEDVPGYIGVRLDCGDSGTFYLTYEQATELAKQLTSMTR